MQTRLNLVQSKIALLNQMKSKIMHLEKRQYQVLVDLPLIKLAIEVENQLQTCLEYLNKKGNSKMMMSIRLPLEMKDVSKREKQRIVKMIQLSHPMVLLMILSRTKTPRHQNRRSKKVTKIRSPMAGLHRTCNLTKCRIHQVMIIMSLTQFHSIQSILRICLKPQA